MVAQKSMYGFKSICAMTFGKLLCQVLAKD